MIIGTGIDVVDIARFGESLERTPLLLDRLFTEAEKHLPLPSLAARFAAKEAMAKALDKKEIFSFLGVEVFNHPSGKPDFRFNGEMAEYLKSARIHLTLSHDAGIASAMVIVEEVP